MNILLLGLGTVGSGVVEVLENNKDKIKRLVGKELRITHAFVKDKNKDRTLNTEDIEIFDDINRLKSIETDLIIEVMGGTKNTKELIKSFLEREIPVVTANKDMLALYIDELEDVADQKNVHLKYEAAVAGSIPVIRTLETSFNSNEVSRVMGILNGTTNFILTKMAEGKSYDDVLQEAKNLGYAEANPTNDVDGIDAMRKILLLARLAFNKKFNVDDIELRGIRNISNEDITELSERGYTVKLIGDAEIVSNKVSISVQPKAIKNTHMLSHTNGSMNAVYFYGNAFRESFLYGPGAGSLETASAVVSDVMNVFLEQPNFQIPTEFAEINSEQQKTNYFVRTKDGKTEVKLSTDALLQNDSDVLSYFEMIGD